MKYWLLSLLIVMIAPAVQARQDCPIIPLPQTADKTNEIFTLNAITPVVVQAPAFRHATQFLQQQLLRYTGIPVQQQAVGKAPAIVIRQSNTKAATGSYSLLMTAKQITITAASEEGAFYGMVSLLQLARQATVNNNNLTLPCWNIQDAPLYQWRGLMLDESRQFFGAAVVKTLLDQMALYKLNRFHWHLTDESGWRIDIRQYPLLASVGGKGNHNDSTAPVKYYTQQEIADIVTYAAERHITVIPEIDMPGHATAANRAYPAFSGGGSVKHPEFTFHPGKEATYQYLSNILQEVNILFPANMIHLGGDEVSFGNDRWQQDADVQQLMKREKLNNVTAVEHYFIKRMADTLSKLNSEILGWDEIVESDLNPAHTIVFWWRHEKPAQLTTALDKGFRVVLCPRLPFYFDFVQDSTHTKGRKWNKLYNALENVYRFSVTSLPVDAAHRKQIMGIQANVWTETMVTTERLEYMLYPRIYALAEAAWSNEQQKDYKRFEQRLLPHLLLLQQDSLHYYNPMQPSQTPEVKK